MDLNNTNSPLEVTRNQKTEINQSGCADQPVVKGLKETDSKDDGNVYLGEIKNGLKSGHGRIEWRDGGERDGDIYEGEFCGEGNSSDL